MDSLDALIERRGRRFRIYVLASSGWEWGLVSCDGVDVWKGSAQQTDPYPLALALDLSGRVCAGEFDSLSFGLETSTPVPPRPC